MRRLLFLLPLLGCARFAKKSEVYLVAPKTPTSFSKYLEVDGKVYGPEDYEVLGEFSDTVAVKPGGTLEAEVIVGKRVRELGGDGVVEMGIVVPELEEKPPDQKNGAKERIKRALEVLTIISTSAGYALIVAGFSLGKFSLLQYLGIFATFLLCWVLILALASYSSPPELPDRKLKLVLKGKVVKLKDQ